MLKQQEKITVVGLGYVGLPLALLADAKGYQVTGLDINEKNIAALKAGKSHIDDIKDADVKKSKVNFTTDAADVATSDIVIICVPTPLIESSQLPDLGPVRSAVSGVTPYLKKGALLILESTVNPGVCDEIVIPLIEKLSAKKVGKDVEVAYCPERINPGDPNWNVSNINRVVGGNTPKALDRAAAFYGSIIDAEIKKMGSIKEAEAVKVVENSFRDVNIAFVNELAMSFHQLGINLENVIDGAATKPFAFMAHRPGCGVGGHCIPIDPYYLIDYAHGFGFEHDFLRMARRTNERMPEFTIDLLKEGLEVIKQPVNGTKVALLGMSYKRDVGDARESPAFELLHLLEEKHADFVTFDPHMESKAGTGSLEKALEHATAIVIATDHKEFKEFITPEALKKYDIKVVIDGRNMLRPYKDELLAQGTVYHGIGI